MFFLLTLQEAEIYVAGESKNLLMRWFFFFKNTTLPKEVEGKMICMCGKNGIGPQPSALQHLGRYTARKHLLGWLQPFRVAWTMLTSS